ncbi:MAG: hypothetical protein IT567_01065 [Alphaproteobacteria bacterium]|nr:hypothetical protein [Alphaproteobacteria bacterium]
MQPDIPPIVEDTKALLEKERRLGDATRLPFRYIGQYSMDKAYTLPVYSEFFASELARELNRAIPKNALHRVRFGSAERQYGEDTVRYEATRWNVSIPVEAVSDAFMERIKENDFLNQDLAMLITTLTERYYDFINSAATAAACQRAYENDLRLLKSERTPPKEPGPVEKIHNPELLEAFG